MYPSLKNFPKRLLYSKWMHQNRYLHSINNMSVQRREMDLTESIFAQMYTVCSMIFEDRVAALKAFSFILYNVDQMHFKIEREAGKTFIVFDPSIEPHVQTFPKEISDFLELRRSIVFKDDSVATELRMYGDKQVVLIGSHSVCDGKFFQELVDAIQHKGVVKRGITQSYVAEIDPHEIESYKFQHSVQPNKFKILRQAQLDLPVEQQNQKYQHFDLVKLPHLRTRISQRMILIALLLRLKTAEALN